MLRLTSSSHSILMEFKSYIQLSQYGKIEQGGNEVCVLHNFYGNAILYRLTGTNKVYLLVTTYRYLGYRLLFGSDIDHEIVQNFNPETMTQYERLSPTIV